MFTQGSGSGSLRRGTRSGLVALITLIIGGFALAGAARADTAVTVPLADVGQEAWSGTTGGTSLGLAMQSAGDVSGDGVNDLLAAQGGDNASRGLWVLFNRAGSGGPPDLSDLDPSRGYLIRVTNSTFEVSAYAEIGDQNGDGVPDQFVRRGSNDIYVVYGVEDPANDLPKCDPMGTAETRCLDLSGAANPVVDLNGDRKGYMVRSGLTSDGFGGTPVGGDFDGDGSDELAMSASGTDAVDSNRGAIWVSRHDLGSACPAMPSACQLFYSSLTASDVIRIDGPAAGVGFGNNLKGAGDLNGDGREDLLTSVLSDGVEPVSTYAIYGKDWSTSPVGTTGFGPPDGFKLAAPAGALALASSGVGDVNGDGRPDIAALIGNILYPAAWKLGVAYTAAAASADAVVLDPMPTDQGYLVEATATDAVGLASTPVLATGDLNLDGYDEFATGLPTATALEVSGAGAARVYLGQGGSPAEIDMGPSFTADRGFSIVGQADLLGVGGGIADLGDIDEDGLPDFAVAATTGNGRIFVVPGRRLFGTATTGLASDVDDKSATVHGAVDAHGRGSEVYFEYGTSDSYGGTTASQPVEGNNRIQTVEAGLTGLAPQSAIHYRLVVENDLGLKSYGPDRVFTTDATPVKTPGPCEANQAAPGCGKFCEANPKAEGCAKPVAGLSELIAGATSNKVRRGGKVKVRSWITSTGTKPADGVKICARVPKKLAQISGPACRTVGGLAPGQTGKAQFTIKVKAKAKKGAKPTIKLVASGTGLADRTAQVRFSVR